jgi:hypothetical protein
MGWTSLDQFRDQWISLVNTVIKTWVLQDFLKILDELSS